MEAQSEERDVYMCIKRRRGRCGGWRRREREESVDNASTCSLVF